MQKKLIVFLTAFLLATLLCACGKPAEVHTDRYHFVFAELNGSAAAVDAYEAAYIDLSDNGACCACFGSTESGGRWQAAGDTVILAFADSELKGSLKNGVIRLELPGESSGLLAVFALSGYEPEIPEQEPEPEAKEPENSEIEETAETAPFFELADSAEWWQGCWYGWWTMYRQGGEYQKLESDWWDLCAEISFDQHGMRMLFWDEDSSADAPAGMVRFSLLKDDETGAWYAYSKSGNFFKDAISRGEWILEPSKSGYPDTIILSFDDCKDGYGYYNYRFVLRPWGYRWDVVDGDPNRTIRFDDVLPAHYEDWYLPLINSGASMPGRIGG